MNDNPSRKHAPGLSNYVIDDVGLKRATFFAGLTLLGIAIAIFGQRVEQTFIAN